MRNPAEMSEMDRRLWKSYRNELGLGMVLYTVLLVGVLVLVDQESPWAKFLILLPMIGVVFVVRAIYRAVKNSDEFGQLMQTRAMSVGFGASMVAATAFGFVGIADVGHVIIVPWMIFAIGMCAYGFATGYFYTKNA